MRTFAKYVPTLFVSLVLAGCAGSSNDTTVSGAEEDGFTASALVGTYAIVGHDHLKYTSFVFSNSKAAPHTYSATGWCPKVSWGIDCSQAPAYRGKWSIKGTTLTLTGDIDESFTFSVAPSNGELFLSETSGANKTSFKKEDTGGVFASGEVCADMFGNPLGRCENEDNFACIYSGPNTNELTCEPNW